MTAPQTPMVFKDLITEAWRAYHFANGTYVRLDNPVRLNVADNGDHRVLAGDGRLHVIPYGWIRLQIQPKQGMDPFAGI